MSEHAIGSDGPVDSDRTRADRQAVERAAAEVSDVLMSIEFALERAKKSRKVVDKDNVDANASLALGDAIRDLERLRKRLLQDTYFAVDTRLI